MSVQEHEQGAKSREVVKIATKRTASQPRSWFGLGRRDYLPKLIYSDGLETYGKVIRARTGESSVRKAKRKYLKGK